MQCPLYYIAVLSEGHRSFSFKVNEYSCFTFKMPDLAPSDENCPLLKSPENLIVAHFAAVRSHIRQELQFWDQVKMTQILAARTFKSVHFFWANADNKIDYSIY